jgi:hypothetical protein
MDNIEAISYRGPVVIRLPFSRWQVVRLRFLYAILSSLSRAGIRA